MQRSKLHISGLIFMAQSAVSFSLMALCVKWASERLPSLEIVFFRSLFGMIMISALIWKKKVSFIGKEKKLLFFRGLSGFIALSLYFYGISHLPLGTAVILNYTSPIFSALLAILFLKEKPGILIIAMIFVAFAGVYLIIEPDSKSFNSSSVIAVLSAIFAAVAYILIRAIKHREHPLTVIFSFVSISTMGSLFYLPFGFIWPNAIEWLLLVGVAVGSFYGQIWMTISLRRAPASLVSAFSYLTPLLTFTYGFIIFGERITKEAILGGLMIIFAGCLVSYYGTKKNRG